MVRDHLTLELGGDLADFDVVVTPELDGDLAAEAVAAREAVRGAEQTQLRVLGTSLVDRTPPGSPVRTSPRC